jgi:conjugative transfer signal peptidase TraF
VDSIKPKNFRLVLGVFLLISFFYLFCKVFLFNISPSMPIGLYWLSHTKSESLKRGDVVAVCLKGPFLKMGLERNYIFKSGHCSDSAPLIKTVFAIPGDSVVLSKDGMSVNGKNYPLKTFDRDSQQRVLPYIPRGNYLKTSAFWLIGTNDSKSWDSRYWGEVNASQILYQLKPLLTFR